MIKVKDLFGQEIKIGDFVINAAAQYRSGVLRAGVVQNILMKSHKWKSGIETLIVSIKRVRINPYDKKSVTTRLHHESDVEQIVVLRSELLPKDSPIYEVLISTREEIFKKRSGAE